MRHQGNRIQKSEAVIRLMDESRREKQPSHARVKRLFSAFAALGFDNDDVLHVLRYLDMVDPRTMDAYSPSIIRDAFGRYRVRKA